MDSCSLAENCSITTFPFNNILASPRLSRNPFVFSHSSRSIVFHFLLPFVFNNSSRSPFIFNIFLGQRPAPEIDQPNYPIFKHLIFCADHPNPPNTSLTCCFFINISGSQGAFVNSRLWGCVIPSPEGLPALTAAGRRRQGRSIPTQAEGPPVLMVGHRRRGRRLPRLGGVRRS